MNKMGGEVQRLIERFEHARPGPCDVLLQLLLPAALWNAAVWTWIWQEGLVDMS